MQISRFSSIQPFSSSRVSVQLGNTEKIKDSGGRENNDKGQLPEIILREPVGNSQNIRPQTAQSHDSQTPDFVQGPDGKWHNTDDGSLYD